MKNLLKFFIEVGKLKKIPRKGWVLIGIKNAETIAAHTFHEAIMVWLLAKQQKTRLNAERVLKTALIHDLCELYAGDMSPYDEILPKNKKEWPKLFDKWPRFLKSKKAKYYQKKHKKEKIALKKLIAQLPLEIRKEIMGLWQDYELGRTKEGRFVKQAGRLVTLLQALEYSKETKKRPYNSWWIGTKEILDDPVLLKFLEVLEKKFHRK